MSRAIIDAFILRLKTLEREISLANIHVTIAFLQDIQRYYTEMEAPIKHYDVSGEFEQQALSTVKAHIKAIQEELNEEISDHHFHFKTDYLLDFDIKNTRLYLSFLHNLPIDALNTILQQSNFDNCFFGKRISGAPDGINTKLYLRLLEKLHDHKPSIDIRNFLSFFALCSDDLFKQLLQTDADSDMDIGRQCHERYIQLLSKTDPHSLPAASTDPMGSMTDNTYRLKNDGNLKNSVIASEAWQPS